MPASRLAPLPILAAAACAALLCAAAPHSARAQETATGFVFHDQNGNGTRDDGEPGIKGVLVSNQRDVVRTAANGSYSLSVTTDTIIFVTKPSGWAVSVDKDNLPRFYYIHKPGGSPKFYFPGVEPTGPLPASIDFPLTPQDEPDNFRIIAFGDTQPETSQEVRYITDDVLCEVATESAAFGITLGDIMFDDLTLFETYNASVGKIGIPWYNVIGNHDINFDADTDQDSDETYHKYFGPNYFSWDVGQVHFVALDTVEWLGAGKGYGNYRGAISDEQLAWLAANLALVPREKLVVLTMHVPLTRGSGQLIPGARELFDLLKDRDKVLALAGHTHTNEHIYFTEEHGWVADRIFHHLICSVVCGAWWSGPKDYRGIPIADQTDGTPNGYTFIDFKGADYSVRFKAAGYDRDFQMRIFTPEMLTFDRETSPRLVVNFFYGSEKSSTVEYSLDGSEWTPMTYTPQRDPLAMAIYGGPNNTAKPWVRPRPLSTHIWEATFPGPWTRGIHIVRIRATDDFGQPFTAARIFTH